MGKRKVEMKKIEDRQALQVTFSKRKKGLFKKAHELSVLTGVKLLVLAISPAGRPFSFGDEGLIHGYIQGEKNIIPKASEQQSKESHQTQQQQWLDDIERFMMVEDEEEISPEIDGIELKELIREFDRSLMANDEEEIWPESEMDGIALTERFHELERCLVATDQEENSSPEVSPASEFDGMRSSEALASSEDIFDELPPLDVPYYCLGLHP